MSGYFKDVPFLPAPQTLEPKAPEKVDTPSILEAIEKGPAFQRRPKGLSHREHEVMQVVAQGVSNKEAADRLHVCEKTIKFHLTNVYKKLGFKSRAELIVAEANRRAAQSQMMKDL